MVFHQYLYKKILIFCHLVARPVHEPGAPWGKREERTRAWCLNEVLASNLVSRIFSALKMAAL